MKTRPRRAGAWLCSTALLLVCWQLVPRHGAGTSGSEGSRVRLSPAVGEEAREQIWTAKSGNRPDALHAGVAPVECDHCKTGAAIPSSSLPLALDFVQRLAGENAKGETSFPLPDGREARGIIEIRVPGPTGEIDTLSGRLTHPGPGRFSFTRERLEGVSYPLSGTVEIFACETAYRVERRDGGDPQLVALPADAVVCRGMVKVDAGEIAEIPSEHPTNVPIPTYQNGVIPLQSLPGAAAVAYLDFDGEAGPHVHWGVFNAQSPNYSNARIRGVWMRVAEDFAPFNINVTTDLGVYLAAPVNSRQRCIITPTRNAAPSAGGVANIGSFNKSSEISCWAYNLGTEKVCAETISHELGHTLFLFHDGRSFPVLETYYDGHGDGAPQAWGPMSWGPIMGSAYNPSLTQWSKGEYTGANNSEDDLALITSLNNAVDYRGDDAGETLATARYLEIQANNTAAGQGIIGMNTDRDAYRFKTSATGTTTLTVRAVTAGPNLDVLAELVNSSGTVVANGASNLSLDSTVTASLPAGEYTLRVSGSGFGNPSTTGYTAYGSIGAYSFTGTVANAVRPSRFTILEAAPLGSAVGTVVPLLAHGANSLQFTIASGNTGNAFNLDPATGALTVANTSAIDFEALSTNWEIPAWFEMFVNLQDQANPALNEVLRVVVHVSNVNEGPMMTGGSVVIPERLRAGGQVFTVTAIDPDRFDRVASYQIIAGNTGNAFAISASGVISTVAPPSLAGGTSYTLTVRAQDAGSPVASSTATVTVHLIATPPGMNPGGTRRTLYDGISGSTLTSLTSNSRFPLEPDREVDLTRMADSGQGTDLGSSTRAFLIVPYTATYTFWIGGDDACQLLFAASGDWHGATPIASTSISTAESQWDASPSQKSSAIPLTAGQICYLEARHKQGFSNENFSVGWSASTGGQPVISRVVIPGTYLAPHDLNYRPKVLPATLSLFENAAPGSAFGFAVATDPFNPGQTTTYAITGGNGVGHFAIRPGDGRVTVIDPSLLDPEVSYQLQITATDSGSPTLSGSGNVAIALRSAGPLLSSLDVQASPPESASTFGSGVFRLQQEVPISVIPSGALSFQGWTGSGINDVASLATDVVVDTRPTGVAGANFTSMSLTNSIGPLASVEATSGFTWSLLGGGSGSNMDVVTSTVLGSGEALRIDGVTGETRGLLGTMATPASLAVGDTLSLSIDGHYHEPPGNSTAGLIVGFTSSTMLDRTVAARFGTGASAGFSLIRDLNNDNSPGTGSYQVFAATPSGPPIAAVSITPFTVTLSLNRTSETHWTIAAAMGGAMLTTAPVSVTLNSVYDCIVVRNNGLNSDFTIDNVLVSRSAAKTVIASFIQLDSYPAWISGFPLSGDAAEKDADPDGDGFSNLAEMHLGFNPVDAGSRLTLSMGGLQDGVASLVANRLVTAGTFTLQWSGSLTGPWTGSQVLPVAAEGWNVPIPAAASGSRQFYRLSYVPPLP